MIVFEGRFENCKFIVGGCEPRFYAVMDPGCCCCFSAAYTHLFIFLALEVCVWSLIRRTRVRETAREVFHRVIDKSLFSKNVYRYIYMYARMPTAAASITENKLTRVSSCLYLRKKKLWKCPID